MKILSLNIRGMGSGKNSKFGDLKKLCISERPSIFAIQESKCHFKDENWVQALWGSKDCGNIQKEMVGKSGGQFLIWDKTVFEASSELISEFFITIRGFWKSSKEESIIVNVYGPHDDASKRKLWESLDNILGIDEVSWVLCGDFNEVRDSSERLNCEFVENRAKRFNEVIEKHGLIDVPLGGRKFTRVSKDDRKMSKLDRFLVSNKFLALWSGIKVVPLDRDLSDHCPIVLSDGDINFGLKPFKLFDEWFRVEGVEKIIEQYWGEDLVGSRKDCVFRNKLKRLKGCLKEWSKGKFGNLEVDISNSKKEAMGLEIKAESGTLSDGEYVRWLESRKNGLKMRK
ncbi:uncharacterized protein [Rutidosis leptorrhynchoides]|uniref:uncharacterized protein n=1 Tax=Rutidosis leptorrhynchoides TaxID=125765 RepID=UPI003A99F60B